MSYIAQIYRASNKNEVDLMARLVRHDAQGPQEVKTESGDSVWVCMCGLSGKKPLCDGSHKRTQDEDPEKTYVYDKEKRVDAGFIRYKK